MGWEISLLLGNFEVDWGKNHSWHNYADLFQACDVTKLMYPHYGRRRKRNALRKALAQVVPRLELLGHTLKTARAEYLDLIAFEAFWLDDDDVPRPTFEELSAMLFAIDVRRVSRNYNAEDDQDLGELFSYEIAPRLGLVGDMWHLRQLGEALENYSGFSILRLLAQNTNNFGENVTWYYAEHVDEEWAQEEDFVRPLADENRFLLVTEGSSDALIIQKALELRRPEIADFFYFVDMERGYPFSGTGNLYRFCQGLASIGIQNQVLVIFDNDAEGVSNYLRCRDLARPSNMGIMKLPDFPNDRQFNTIGPDGSGLANINGRAASIESFLDLSQLLNSPVIRWKNYVESLGVYQGALEGKEHATKQFFKLDSGAAYDFTGLDMIVNAIEAECVAIAEARQSRKLAQERP